MSSNDVQQRWAEDAEARAEKEKDVLRARAEAAEKLAVCFAEYATHRSHCAMRQYQGSCDCGLADGLQTLADHLASVVKS